jgi:vacuolar-type H+-ATPase subunit H
VNLQNLVDELQNIADRARRIPGGKLMIDEANLREVTDQLRQMAAEEAKAAQRAAAERDRMLTEARAQAKRIVEEAQAQVVSRLDDQGAMQLARERSRTIIADAEQQASRMRAEANTYVANQLSALESRLTRVLREVQAGQRFLTQPSSDQPAQGENSRQS